MTLCRIFRGQILRKGTTLALKLIKGCLFFLQ